MSNETLAPASHRLAPASHSLAPASHSLAPASPFASYLEEFFYHEQPPMISNGFTSSNSLPPSPSIYQVGLGIFENVPVHCPLCSNEMTFSQYFSHLAEDHPITYNFWMYFYQPQPNSLIEYDVDTMSYEELLHLCQTIGNHTPGLTNEDKHAVTEPYKPTLSECHDPPKCPICLTLADTSSSTPVRLKRCRHVFCQECLYEWLESHKTCPLCIQEVLNKD